MQAPAQFPNASLTTCSSCSKVQATNDASRNLGMSEICCIQKDRSLNFAILKQTMPFGCLAQRQNASNGWRQLLVRRRSDQEFHPLMAEIRFSKKDRKVKPSQGLRLLHEPARSERLPGPRVDPKIMQRPNRARHSKFFSKISPPI